MSDQVRNPEDRFSQSEAHIEMQVYITKHYVNMPMQYAAIFQGCKNDNFKMEKKKKIFFLFLLIT